MSNAMEKKVEDLTKKMHKSCIGQDAGVVIGAAFNIAQTALNATPDKQVLAAVAATLRDQADMIDKMVSGGRH